MVIFHSFLYVYQRVYHDIPDMDDHEFVQVEDMEDDDDDMPIGTSMRRSFSDSHLETLKEALCENAGSWRTKNLLGAM